MLERLARDKHNSLLRTTIVNYSCKKYCDIGPGWTSKKRGATTFSIMAEHCYGECHYAECHYAECHK